MLLAKHILSLQWGHVPEDVEGTMADSLQARGITLQWGHVPEDVEGRKVQHQR